MTRITALIALLATLIVGGSAPISAAEPYDFDQTSKCMDIALAEFNQLGEDIDNEDYATADIQLGVTRATIVNCIGYTLTFDMSDSDECDIALRDGSIVIMGSMLAYADYLDIAVNGTTHAQAELNDIEGMNFGADDFGFEEACNA